MKVQTAFRLEKELIKALKAEAKRHKRSLNNYVEFVLSKIVEKEPNDETTQAIDDALQGKELKKIGDVDSFLNNL